MKEDLLEGSCGSEFFSLCHLYFLSVKPVQLDQKTILYLKLQQCVNTMIFYIYNCICLF